MSESYWKANIEVIIKGDINPWDLVAWDEESKCYYFPDDWHQYDDTDVSRIYREWFNARGSTASISGGTGVSG